MLISQTQQKRGERKLRYSLTSEVTCQTHKGGLLKLWIAQLWETLQGKFTSIPALKQSLQKLLFICHTAHRDLPRLSHLQYLKADRTAVPTNATCPWCSSLQCHKVTAWGENALAGHREGRFSGFSGPAFFAQLTSPIPSNEMAALQVFLWKADTARRTAGFWGAGTATLPAHTAAATGRASIRCRQILPSAPRNPCNALHGWGARASLTGITPQKPEDNTPRSFASPGVFGHEPFCSRPPLAFLFWFYNFS